ncbi:hypothetical protein HanIR_Chr08g0372181 [Helianthus annuus]|nr:hypothetical protein HanIR_Chr08g0372181 [Helianthus annuus]
MLVTKMQAMFCSCVILPRRFGTLLQPLIVLEPKDLVNIHKYMQGSSKWKKVIYLVLQTTMWCIWKARNDLIFNSKQPIVGRIKDEIRALGFLWLRSRAKASSVTWTDWCNFDLSCFIV